MGQGGSKSLRLKSKTIRELAEKTLFTEVQIVELHKHFRKISASEADDGLINEREFFKALGVEPNLFYHRMFDIFDKDKTGQINFREFIMGMSTFAEGASFEAKINFSFQVYDKDGDGYIDSSELRELLQAALQENRLLLTEEQIDRVINRTVTEADQDRDGKVSLKEYEAMVAKHPSMLELMTVGGISTGIRAAGSGPAAAGGGRGRAASSSSSSACSSAGKSGKRAGGSA